MWSYANKPRCRRRQILDYFGETTPITNCHCDACVRPVATATERWQPTSTKPASKSASYKKTTKRTSKAALSTDPLNPQAELRFERLKKVRRQLADKHQWPAFCIMHDSTLMEVARRAPSTVREFAEIKGIGEKKAVHFGPEFLKVLGND